MAEIDLSWTPPVMRAGYAGRGLVYVVVAGISLWAIWHGGQAQGTGSAFSRLEGSTWGVILLVLIAVGLLAYAVWRLVNAIWDLECHGSDAKGMFARVGLAVSGLIYLGIAGTAAAVLFTSADAGDGSTIVRWTGRVMSWPAGRWLVCLGGLAVIGVGLYMGYNAWSEKYREKLTANRFTLRWNKALQAGLVAHGVVLLVVGGLFIYAGLTANPGQAGGTDRAFEWIYAQAYGRILVVLVCLGLLAFALFCFVNAAYRTIPRVAGDDVETLAARLKAKATG
jgi:hypothetical protein